MLKQVYAHLSLAVFIRRPQAEFKSARDLKLDNINNEVNII